MGFQREVKYQYLAGICVNIISISNGAFSGWPSASLVELQAPDSPLSTGPLSKQDAGWVVGIFCIGGLVGTPFSVWIAESLGRKRCLQLLAPLGLLSWVLIPYATTPTDLIIARFIGGFVIGACFSVIPIYTTELADDNVRGVLGTFLVLTCNIGVLYVFVLGYYYTYSTVAWIQSIATIVFLIAFSFLPETPHHLMKKNKVNKAEKSLRYYRNMRNVAKEMPEHLKFELDKLKNVEKDPTDVEEPLTLQDFTTKSARKAILIGVVLMAVNQLCGCFAMLNYTATIFEQSGSAMQPKMAAIIIGALQIVGAYMSTLLVERAGRKLLLIVSLLGVFLGHTMMGTFSYLSLKGYDTQLFSWVPVASFSVAILLGNCGIVTLPYLVLSEVLPPKIRDMASMLCMIILWSISFFVLTYLPILSDLLGMHGLMLFFASFCLFGAIFIMLYVPETKGKSIDEIIAILEK